MESKPESGDARLEQLVGRCKSRDPVAFDELMNRFQDWIFSVNLQIVRNPDDAVDLTQETFLRAWKAFPKFDGRNAVGAWLRRIAVNAAIDFTRRQRPVPCDPETVEGLAGGDPAGNRNPIPDPATSLERSELGASIRAALDQLSPDHRAVILLKEIEGLSYREMASMLHCSVGTIMSRLFYARRSLRARLTDLHPTTS